MSDINHKTEKLEKNIQRAIKGKPEVIRAVIIGLLSQGHILIEDVPGVGKTTLAQALARSTELTFKRIQFTSDLLPTDIIGVSVLNQRTGEFEFKSGPVFANVVLIDEINRATPKTQSALLEAMSEARVTVEGRSYPLPRPFMVIATQNPLEYHGTFPLPENQLDRFFMRVSIGYPDRESEKEILIKFGAGRAWDWIEPVMTQEEVFSLQGMVDKVKVDDTILDYILAIIKETRNKKVFELGVSPRGAIALKRAAQARALIEGRNYTIPDNVKEMAVSVLAHRVLLKLERGGRKEAEENALMEILSRVPVPV